MMNQVYIENFDCITSTGNNRTELYNALLESKNGITIPNQEKWPKKFKNFWQAQVHPPISCKIKTLDQNKSDLYNISTLLERIIRSVLENHDNEIPMGIIFASTKGASEDLVINENISTLDPLDLVLEEVLNKFPEVKWHYKQCVSNSCASSHAALALGKKWIESNSCKKVLIIAADLIGPFIQSGFQSLKALSPTKAKCFQKNRDGLVLGDAAAAILLSDKKSQFKLTMANIANEAHTVTAASEDGAGLFSCLEYIIEKKLLPDFAILHGTATTMNDAIEDRVMFRLQSISHRKFPLTATKWSHGHTLGASGAIDVIAALMAMINNKLFSLQAESANDSLLSKEYLWSGFLKQNLNSALITSLGFGGTNGALFIERVLD
jgi:3-oxoacyl-[acyl-carrier-protein] synthase-1